MRQAAGGGADSRNAARRRDRGGARRLPSAPPPTTPPVGAAASTAPRRADAGAGRDDLARSDDRAAARALGRRCAGASCRAGTATARAELLARVAAQLRAAGAGLGRRLREGAPARRRRRPTTRGARLAAAAAAAVPRRVARRATPIGLATGYFEPLRRRVAHVARRLSRRAVRARRPTSRRASPYWTRQQLDTAAGGADEPARSRDRLGAPIRSTRCSCRCRARAGCARPSADGARAARARRLRGHNDQPYRSVGRWLIDQGELRASEASWPAIRAWARRNPGRVDEMLWSNPRFVFFREEPLPDPSVGPQRRAGRAADAGALDRRRPAERPLRHAGLARHHRAARDAAAAPPRRWPRTPAARSSARCAPTTSGAGAKTPRQQAGRMKQPLRMWVLWPLS